MIYFGRTLPSSGSGTSEYVIAAQCSRDGVVYTKSLSVEATRALTMDVVVKLCANAASQLDGFMQRVQGGQSE